MEFSVLRNKKFLALLLIVATASSAVAIALNWHKVAEITGVVKKSPVSVKEVASINLGELEAGSEFCEAGEATIFVEEGTEAEITKLFLAIPELVEESLEIFSELKLDIVIGRHPMITVECRKDIPVVPFPGAPCWKWADYDEIEGTYYHFFSYGYWSTVSLSEGDHTITFTLHGTTATPPEDTTIDLKIYVEIQECKD